MIDTIKNGDIARFKIDKTVYAETLDRKSIKTVNVKAGTTLPVQISTYQSPGQQLSHFSCEIDNGWLIQVWTASPNLDHYSIEEVEVTSS